MLLQVYKGTRGGVQDVAIKMLNYSDDLQLQQFCLEIQLLKSLSFDRNIVQFYGACLHDEHPVLVSPYAHAELSYGHGSQRVAIKMSSQLWCHKVSAN